tara:strand:- start:4367 stop:4567 length:201 start_codon:yes stop_codon:yes gene_type:complete
LKIDYCGSCVRSENPIDLSGIKPEIPQVELEIGDVISSEHLGVQVKVSITQSDAGLHQSRMCLLVE